MSVRVGEARMTIDKMDCRSDYIQYCSPTFLGFPTQSTFEQLPSVVKWYVASVRDPCLRFRWFFLVGSGLLASGDPCFDDVGFSERIETKPKSCQLRIMLGYDLLIFLGDSKNNPCLRWWDPITNWHWKITSWKSILLPVVIFDELPPSLLRRY